MKDLFNTPIVRMFGVFLLACLLVSLTTYANDSYGIVEGGKLLINITCIVSTILWAAVLASVDSKLIITNHAWRVVYRFLLLSFIPAILAIQHNDWRPLLLAISNYGIFWMFFDGFYDVDKKENPFIIGSTAVTDKFLDWLSDNLGVWAPLTIKLIYLSLSQIAVIKWFL